MRGLGSGGRRGGRRGAGGVENIMYALFCGDGVVSVGSVNVPSLASEAIFRDVVGSSVVHSQEIIWTLAGWEIV